MKPVLREKVSTNVADPGPAISVIDLQNAQQKKFK
jgi:hypothetical protein